MAATFSRRAVRDANAPLVGSIGAPLVAARFTFLVLAPCVAQMPLFCAFLAHPSWLQRLVVVPCVTQMLVHPLWLQQLVVTPCVMQTPPLTAPLAHPSWLQRLHLVLTVCAPLIANNPGTMEELGWRNRGKRPIGSGWFYFLRLKNQQNQKNSSSGPFLDEY